MPFLRFGVLVRHFAPTVVYFDMTHVSNRDVGYRAYYLGPKTELADRDDLLHGVDRPLSAWYRTRLAATRGAAERTDILAGFAGLSRIPLEYDWFRDELEKLRRGGARTSRAFERVMRSLRGVGTRTLVSFQETTPLFNRIFLQWMDRGKGRRDPQVVRESIGNIEGGEIFLKDRAILRVAEEYSRVFSDEFFSLVQASQFTDWSRIRHESPVATSPSAGASQLNTPRSSPSHAWEEVKLGLVVAILELLEEAYPVPMKP